MKIQKNLLLIVLFTQITVQTSFAQKITADTSLAKQYYILADDYYYSENLDSSNIYYQKAADIYKKIAETNSDTTMWEKHVKLMYYISWNLTSQSQFKRSIEILDTTLFIALKYLGKNSKQTANIYAGLGNVYNKKSEYDKALDYHFKCLEIVLELFGKNNMNVASSYNNIGMVYSDKSEYDKALEYYFKSLKIRLKLFGEKHLSVAGSYNNIGTVYDIKSEYDKALEYYFKSLEIRLEQLGEKHTDVASSYNNIGIVYDKKSEYDKALQYYVKSLEIRLELLGRKDIYMAKSYGNIGFVYKNKSEYDKALKYHFKSLEIFLDLLGDKHIYVANSYMNIGNVYSDKSEYDKVSPKKRDSLFSSALEYYFKSLEIYLQLFGKKHTFVARSYNKIGNVYKEKYEHNLALEYYQKGLASCLWNFNDTVNIYSVPEIKNYLEWNELLKTLQAKAKIFTDTSKHLSESLELSERLQLALRHYQACDTLISMVRKEIDKESDKIALGEQANEIYKGAIDVCLNLSKLCKDSKLLLSYQEQAFYFSEKNKSSVLLEALAGSEALQYAGIPDTLLQIEHKLSIDIANYKNLKNNADNDSLRKIWSGRLFAANRSYDSLITVFETNYPDYYNLKYNNSPATVEQISNLLDKKNAILSYFVGNSTITIFAISKKDYLVTQISKPDTLNKMISDYRFYISNTDLLKQEVMSGTHKSVDLYQELAIQFYNLLFPPKIQEFLKGGLFYDIKNLIIIPDGQLAIIPFETFFTEEYNAEWTDWKNYEYFSEMPYLIKDYAISYSYSATLFQQTFSVDKTTNPEFTKLNDWLALAPVFDGIKSSARLADGNIVEALPGTETEVKTISNLFESNELKSEIKLYSEANENTIKSGKLSNYKYLHFATHGFVNIKNPALSGIVLAQDTTIKFEGYENIYGKVVQQNDGMLYQSEIYNLELNANLIVLSACKTGLGKIEEGEGVIGLTRALLYAGTDNIIVSLWSVSDNSTSELMINFYRNLLNNKKTQGFNKHLQEAKLEMIEDGKYAHPYFWSPFILIGK